MVDPVYILLQIESSHFIFVENKQQSDSAHLFTIIKRNKLKSTHQCLSIEYILSQKGDYILNYNSINTRIDCYNSKSIASPHS